MRNSLKTLVTIKTLLIMAVFILLLPFQELAAQAKKPTPKKPAANRSAQSKPAAKKPDVNKPSINKQEANRSVPNRPGADSKSGNKPSVNKSDDRNIGKRDAGGSSGKTNNVNIDNSKKNVNINVDKSKDIHINNSRNTSVRRNTRAYVRPPHVYGGYRYRCYHPYYYHPYRPFVWGPRWHPWGFFIATLATTAIIVSIVDNDMDMPGDFDMASNARLGWGNYPGESQLLPAGPAYVTYRDFQEYTMNQSNKEKLAADGDYYYDDGVFYLKGNGGYTVVSAPVGAKIKTLPTGYETVSADDGATKNYYYGGAFYEKRSDGYVVVTPLAGTLVENISEGGEEVKLGEITYIKLGETYFQPVKENGKNMYEVADVEADK